MGLHNGSIMSEVQFESETWVHQPIFCIFCTPKFMDSIYKFTLNMPALTTWQVEKNKNIIRGLGEEQR